MDDDTVLCSAGATVGSWTDVLYKRDLPTSECLKRGGLPLKPPINASSARSHMKLILFEFAKFVSVFQRLAILCHPAEEPAGQTRQNEEGTNVELMTTPT